ncbi:MAG TPA: hypothetical protein VH475_07370, partial [Tepidisphaeraceae bacterium]
MNPRDLIRRLVVSVVLLAGTRPVLAAPGLTFCCSAHNDVYLALGGTTTAGVARFDTPAEAVERAGEGTGLLVLAGGYPTHQTALDDAFFTAATNKRLRLYLEFP